jgi:sugar transferase (PEP-CTERM/EpsH1 system associated)
VRILFLTHRLPYAPNRGDRIRATYLLREMRAWADVDVISLVHDRNEASHTDDLRDVASSVRVARVPRTSNLVRTVFALLGRTPATHTLLHSAELGSAVFEAMRLHAPDLVFVFCTGIAPAVLNPILAGVPVVLDMVDVDSAKWASLAVQSVGAKRWLYAREARLLSCFEQSIASRVAVTLVTTRSEAETLKQLAPECLVEVVSNGIDVEAYRPTLPTARSERVVFCGVMNYAPNVTGAIWLAKRVWPLVRRARPHALLQIVGAEPTRAVAALADSASGVVVTGTVTDVRPFLWQAAVAAAPLQTARGVQNKVLEAVAAGLPVVVTPATAVGIPDEIRAACEIAAEPGAFAEALVNLLGREPGDRRAIVERADVSALSWTRRLSRLRPLLEQAASTRPA